MWCLLFSQESSLPDKGQVDEMLAEFHLQACRLVQWMTAVPVPVPAPALKALPAPAPPTDGEDSSCDAADVCSPDVSARTVGSKPRSAKILASPGDFPMSDQCGPRAPAPTPASPNASTGQSPTLAHQQAGACCNAVPDIINLTPLPSSPPEATLLGEGFKHGTLLTFGAMTPEEEGMLLPADFGDNKHSGRWHHAQGAGSELAAAKLDDESKGGDDDGSFEWSWPDLRTTTLLTASSVTPHNSFTEAGPAQFGPHGQGVDASLMLPTPFLVPSLQLEVLAAADHAKPHSQPSTQPFPMTPPPSPMIVTVEEVQVDHAAAFPGDESVAAVKAEAVAGALVVEIAAADVVADVVDVMVALAEADAEAEADAAVVAVTEDAAESVVLAVSEAAEAVTSAAPETTETEEAAVVVSATETIMMVDSVETVASDVPPAASETAPLSALSDLDLGFISDLVKAMFDHITTATDPVTDMVVMQEEVQLPAAVLPAVAVAQQSSAGEHHHQHQFDDQDGPKTPPEAISAPWGLVAEGAEAEEESRSERQRVRWRA